MVVDDDSSSDDDVDVSLSLVALDFVWVDFEAEAAGFDEAVVRFFTVRLPVADFPRVFLTGA